jgi:hypothetical protein
MVMMTTKELGEGERKCVVVGTESILSCIEESQARNKVLLWP